MIQISKNEAFEMRKQCGSHSVKHTWSRHKPKTYYLVENPRNLKALENYRKQEITLTVTEKDVK